MKISGFDWDRGNLEKCQKHGVSLAEIEALFTRRPLVAPNPIATAGEERFIAIGRNIVGRAIFVAFTLRKKGKDTFIRPISARYMHRKEIEAYEKKGSQT
jgi:uncharacterized DUF497 family protein